MYVQTMVAQDLGEITVTTATKTEKKIDGIAASVEVITEKKLKEVGATSLKEALEKTSGVHLQYGTFPNASSKSKSSISIRGMSVNGTLLLIDGRRLAGEVKNPFDLDRIPASIIERIEIVKGPMSTLYGADATGGVINIITKQPTSTPVTNIELKYGANKHGDGDVKNINFDTRGKIGNFKYSIYANHTNTDPYTQRESTNVYAGGSRALPSAVGPLGGNIPNSYSDLPVTYREDSQTSNIGSRLEYDFNEQHTLGFEFNYMDEERSGSYIGYFHPSNYTMGGNQIPIFNVPVESEDDNKRLDLGLDFTSFMTDKLTTKFKVYRSDYKKRNNTFATYWDQMGYASKEDSKSDGMRADVEVMTYEAIANYAITDAHLITAGVEKRDEQRDATVFAQANEFSRKEVDYKAIYLQDEWEIDETLNAIFGVRYDAISSADNKATFKVGMVKNFSELWNLRGNFAQGYRAPDIRELYINKQTPAGLQQGSETVGYDLKPEFTNSLEVGLSGHQGKFSYQTSLFYNKIKDRISEVNKGSYYTFENISKAKTYGSELSLSYDFTQELNTTFNWNELRTKNDDTGEDLELNPERILSLNVGYKITPTIQTSIMAKYIGEQYYLKTLNKGASNESTDDAQTNAYTLVNLNLSYKMNKNIELFGGVDNIFNRKVDDVLGSNKGTFFFTGLRATF
jgi:outer membrane receptor for ferrienterochelin and colicins